MKSQILFSRKNKKNTSVCHLLKSYPACKVLSSMCNKKSILGALHRSYKITLLCGQQTLWPVCTSVQFDSHGYCPNILGLICVEA